ncbi:MAG TPA: BolA/IbaG family iron-sulfur metabolism protein [Gammaproteobacteria bacterium]
MDPQAVAERIEEGIPGAQARVRTDGAGHYEAVVISDAFDGERTLKRHQRVYGTLGSLVGNELHALNLKTFTPEEWQAGAD